MDRAWHPKRHLKCLEKIFQAFFCILPILKVIIMVNFLQLVIL